MIKTKMMSEVIEKYYQVNKNDSKTIHIYSLQLNSKFRICVEHEESGFSMFLRKVYTENGAKRCIKYIKKFYTNLGFKVTQKHDSRKLSLLKSSLKRVFDNYGRPIEESKKSRTNWKRTPIVKIDGITAHYNPMLEFLQLQLDEIDETIRALYVKESAYTEECERIRKELSKAKAKIEATLRKKVFYKIIALTDETDEKKEKS